MNTEKQPTSEIATPFARSIAATPLRAPNRSTALEQYRLRARFYDAQLALAEPVRRRAIERLGLRRGETVLDVGCGTGLSFELLEQRIGHDAGKIVGIEQSSDMIEQARARAERNRFENLSITHKYCRAVSSSFLSFV
jgi:ubiquinone/menaquinone biosynthesis C-methylase UbiE